MAKQRIIQPVGSNIVVLPRRKEDSKIVLPKGVDPMKMALTVEVVAVGPDATEIFKIEVGDSVVLREGVDMQQVMQGDMPLLVVNAIHVVAKYGK